MPPPLPSLSFLLITAAFLSTSLFYTSHITTPLDCMKWAADHKIVPYDSFQAIVGHTLIAADGSLHANPGYPNDSKDACTRALHARLKADHSSSGRLLEALSYSRSWQRNPQWCGNVEKDYATYGMNSNQFCQCYDSLANETSNKCSGTTAEVKCLRGTPRKWTGGNNNGFYCPYCHSSPGLAMNPTHEYCGTGSDRLTLISDCTTEYLPGSTAATAEKCGVTCCQY